MIIKVINKVYTLQLINVSWDSDTVQEIDNVSIDEFDYNDDAASKVLDLIYAETHFRFYLLINSC
jgi:hypothetical protein